MGHGQSKRLGDLDVDDQLELGRLINRQICRFLALEHPTGVGSLFGANASRSALVRDQRAGTTSHGKRGGYRKITIDGKVYSAARLAWFYKTGRWPDPEIDHINRIRDDNRWENLREATRADNLANRAL